MSKTVKIVIAMVVFLVSVSTLAVGSARPPVPAHPVPFRYTIGDLVYVEGCVGGCLPHAGFVPKG
jgi:hypothetical protein